jgi:hypothetical protein
VRWRGAMFDESALPRLLNWLRQESVVRPSPPSRRRRSRLHRNALPA